MMLSAFVASQAQLISFNALRDGVTDDAEIKKELILNGFTKVTDASDSIKDTYAYRYDEEEEQAAIWVTISTIFHNDSVARSYGASPGWCTIEMQSSGHEIYEYLKNEIVQNCTFEGIGYDDALEYKFKSKANFYISSVNGTNLIEVSPPLETLNQLLEPLFLEFFEKLRQEKGVGETEGSEGITQGTRNQGDPNGTPDADRYDTGGGLGDGISFGGLGSRGAIGNLPKPNMSGCEVTQKIEVRVEIQVDEVGKVISAIVTSATYQDNCIWTMVVDAAKRSRFSVDLSAPYRQTGWIKYIIVP